MDTVGTEVLGGKNTDNSGEIKHYISYFQSVTTIGITSRAKSAKEAEEKAKGKLSRSDFMCGVIGQTQFEPMATEEWNPTLKIEE